MKELLVLIYFDYIKMVPHGVHFGKHRTSMGEEAMIVWLVSQTKNFRLYPEHTVGQLSYFF